MARKIDVFDDAQKRINQVSEDIESAFGKTISDRCLAAIERLYTVEGDFDSEGSSPMEETFYPGFPHSEVGLVINLTPRIVRTKGIEEFEKIVDKVYQTLQEGKIIVETNYMDHHWIPVGKTNVLTYNEEACQKIRDYMDEVTDQIRRSTCNAGLELNVEIKRDKSTGIIDEIRDWDSKETARKPDFPNLKVVLIIEGKVRVPIDNVRFYSYPKKFEMYGKTDHLDLVAPQWLETKEISGFICHGIGGRCDDACKYHTEQS